VLSFEPVGAAGGEPRAPVLLLHGSPGSARNFEDLGQALASTGRPAHALDLPGFGRSTRAAPSYSILAHAHAALGALDALGI
jgi:pimeloyl-ACP methyl ester carboxylesterase